MPSNIRARALLAALVVTVLAAGCDSATAPPSIEPAAAPLQQSRAPGAPGYHPVAGAVAEFDVRGIIGPEGGSLGVAGFSLTVPRGAVQQPTLFTFRSANSGYIEVVLTATAVGSREVNDVGASGFTVPLTLAIGYSPAGGMPKWSRLVVARVLPDGTLEPLPSGFNPVHRVVVGKVDRFSTFTVAAD